MIKDFIDHIRTITNGDPHKLRILKLNKNYNAEYLTLLKEFPNIKELNLQKSVHEKLDIESPFLKKIHIGEGLLKECKINCPNLEKLVIIENKLEEINISHLKKLKTVNLKHNNLKTINLSNPALIGCNASFNKIKNIEISSPIENLVLAYNNLENDYDIKINPKSLFNLDVSNNPLKSLNLNFPKLKTIDASNCFINSLELKKSPKIEHILLNGIQNRITIKLHTDAKIKKLNVLNIETSPHHNLLKFLKNSNIDYTIQEESNLSSL